MRFFRLNKKFTFDWKYVFGELLLLFVGITLAIWFNNWNSQNQIEDEKKIALEKIKGEIQNNLDEMLFAQEKNEMIRLAFTTFQNLYEGTSTRVITTPERMDSLQKAFPNYFRITDSTKVEQGKYDYRGNTFIVMEIPELTEIAWETTRSMNVTNEFSFDCLYEFESMYNLQRRVLNEVNKASDALQKKDLTELMNVLSFMEQFNPPLIENYQNMLEEIDNCL